MFNIAGNGSSGYNLTNSVRFRSSASAYLSRTPASASNQKTWTWSGWVKRGALGTRGGLFGSVDTYIQFIASDILEINLRVSTTNYIWTTTQVFRDPLAWYHIVLAVDTTQATATDRMKLYVNGSQVTSFALSATIPQNADTRVNSTALHTIGSYNASTDYLDGYQTEINFVNAQQLTPSSFGSTDSTTGQWLPKKYTGTYGTNGFYLNFADNSALTTTTNVGLGKDNSGNGNYWTTNNISITAGTTYDSMTDVPTLTSATVANYAVLNPLDRGSSTLVDGNLNASTIATAISSTMAVTSGKYYAEFTYGSTNNVNALGVGVVFGDGYGISIFSSGVGYYGNNGNKYVSGTASAYGATFTTNNVIGVALDVTGGTVTFYKNNTSQGAITLPTSTSGWRFSVTTGNATQSAFANFGQRPFSYTPPTGFVALNTYNLPTPTILQGNKYMDATTYTGTGATLSVTNASAFKPDLVWIKSRSGATDHALYDFVRGTTKDLVSNSTAAETTQATGLTAFNTNGFTVGALAKLNTSAATYVGWQWQAGQGSSSSNTSGSITSTVSVNTTAGFSVVTYTGNGSTTGATVGHSLGVAPKMIIVKNRTRADNWLVQTASTGATGYLNLDGTGAFTLSARPWNNTAPTSTVFTVNTFGAETWTNKSSDNYVAYCWAEISGYSKAFSYTGNGSTDGSFVYTGFLPRFVMIKRTDTTGDWYMWDTARNTYDVITNTLLANSSAAETSATSIDALSNGFKLRNTTAGFNASGGTYIGMAWATNPFKNSNAF